jgi:hypothetical protein
VIELRCTNCGAGLARPPPPATLLRCQFCGAQMLLEPPPPPPHVYGASARQAQAAVIGRPKPAPRAPVILVLVVGLVITTVTVAAIVVVRPDSGRRGSRTGLDPATLATVSLRATPESMAAVLGVAADKDLDVQARLKGTGFESVNFHWDKADLSHVSSFGFTSGAPVTNDADARVKIRALLGRRFERSTAFYWDSASLYYEPTNLNAKADGKTSNPGRGPDDPHWKDRLDALWDVTRRAVLGLNVPVTDVERRDWLGGGYPLSSLEAVDLDVDVDGSVAMMRRAFAGVSSRFAEGIAFDVPIDHPWFSTATLDWPDIKGGHLSGAHFVGPPGVQSLQDQVDIETCLQATYGKPRTDEVDHLKGTHKTTFKLPDGDVRVDPHTVDIDVDTFVAQHFTAQERKAMRLPSAMSKSGWSKVIATLDACGHK